MIKKDREENDITKEREDNTMKKENKLLISENFQWNLSTHSSLPRMTRRLTKIPVSRRVIFVPPPPPLSQEI
jgi:hypothetical protein